jgi:pilus assembly protein Flp/PilA
MAMVQFVATFQRWLLQSVREREGQALVEYALILALVAVAAIAALHFLGGAANRTLNNVAGQINSP